MSNTDFYEKFRYKKHSGNMYIAGISKEELENNDISSVLKAIETARGIERKLDTNIPVTQNIKADKKLHAGLLLHFNGYDSDPREMFEIPETKSFFEKLLKEIPGLLYYLENTNILLLFNCLFTARSESHQPILDPSKMLEFLETKIPETENWIQNKFHRMEFKDRLTDLIKDLFNSSEQVPL